MDHQLLPMHGVHASMDDTEATAALIRHLHPALPDDARPPSLDDEPYVRQMAAYFSSYLLASFRLREHPPDILAPTHCPCPICARVVRASYLVPRRVGSRAKRSATEASVEAVERLAEAVGRTLAAESARALVEQRCNRRHAALVAYAHDLVERIQGRSGDEMSLALWRRFAYTPQGAPIQSFELTLTAVRDAQSALVKAITASEPGA